MRRLLTVLAALATLSLTNCGYNAIQSEDEQIKSSWSEVVNQYQRRADLVPNLVNSVKGFAQQEKDVLLGVTNARAIPVRVSLRRDGMSYRSFGYADDCGARTALTGAGWLELAAGETRAQAFDHRWCGGHESLLTARGSLGGDSTETRQLLLRR